MTRFEAVFLACCLSLVGGATAVLRLLANPNSRLSQRLDNAVRAGGPR